MTGLLKHCLDFVIKYNALKLYPYSGVTRKNGKTLLFTDWVFFIIIIFKKLYYSRIT